MDFETSTLIGICLLAYSTTVMRHYIMAVNTPGARINVNRNLKGALPTIVNFLHVPVFFWLPIFLFMKSGLSGLVVWVVLMVGAWVLATISGLTAFLVIHFWLATILSIPGIYLTAIAA